MKETPQCFTIMVKSGTGISDAERDSTYPLQRTADRISRMGEPNFTDKIYSTTKLAALVDKMVEIGHDSRDILHGLDVNSEALYSTETRISLQQFLVACRNAIQLSKDPHLPFQVGSNIHLSAYGMYGYAILCSPNFRKTMRFACHYHFLATPTIEMSFSEEDTSAIWTLKPFRNPLVDQLLYRFLTELQIGIHLSLHRDIMGSAFFPNCIDLTYRTCGDFRVTEELVGCPVRFQQPENRIIYDASWLDQAAKLGNRTTYDAVVSQCDGLLSDLTSHTGIAEKMRTIILQNVANPPTFEESATILGTTTRTLRRQLINQDTSYRKLLDELRTQIAIKYLREYSMTNESAAFALGFSDSTNFRRAFRRWTGHTPSEFRNEHCPASDGFNQI